MVTRITTRTGSQASPGTKIDADIDNTNNAVNAHVADTTTHGTTGAIVGTTDTQTLSSKTFNACTISGALKQFAMNREAITASATAAADTVIAAVSTLSAAVTITLSTAQITGQSGRFWIICDETGACGNAYNITIATQGSETINGETTLVLAHNYAMAIVYSDGTNLHAEVL